MSSIHIFPIGPSKVTNVSLTVFETSLNVTWTIPQSDMTITQYQVQYRTDETTSWSSCPSLSGSPPATSTVVNGMNYGSEYKVRVRARSAVGAGQWSEEQTQRIGSALRIYMHLATLHMHLHCGMQLSVPLYVKFICSPSSSHIQFA